VNVALRLIEQSRIDIAILDIRLMDEMSFAVGYALGERSIPLMFLTGHKGSNLPVDLGNAILIEKPFKAPMLIETVPRPASLAAAAERPSTSLGANSARSGATVLLCGGR